MRYLPKLPDDSYAKTETLKILKQHKAYSTVAAGGDAGSFVGKGQNAFQFVHSQGVQLLLVLGKPDCKVILTCHLSLSFSCKMKLHAGVIAKQLRQDKSRIQQSAAAEPHPLVNAILYGCLLYTSDAADER